MDENLLLSDQFLIESGLNIITIEIFYTDLVKICRLPLKFFKLKKSGLV